MTNPISTTGIKTVDNIIFILLFGIVKNFYFWDEILHIQQKPIQLKPLQRIKRVINFLTFLISFLLSNDPVISFMKFFIMYNWN